MTELKPEDKISGVMQRTLLNLEFIERRARPSGPFEVIQLVNSFMGAAVHPWENLLASHAESVNLSEASVNWPTLHKSLPDDDEPADFHEQMAWIRHAFAHGNIEYLNEDGEIVGIEIRNQGHSKKQKKPITWGTRLEIQTLRQLLVSYSNIAQQIDTAIRNEQPNDPN